MKKIILLMICLFGIFSLSGCSTKGTVAVGMVETNTNNCINVKYVTLTGVKEYTITVTTETSVDVDIVTDSGSIGLTIGESEYTGNDLSTCNFSVVLQPGTYNVVVTTNKHKGSYKLSW